MTTMEHPSASIDYQYPAHGVRLFAINFGLALVAWGRKRSAHRRPVSYQQQVQRLEAARVQALQLGGIR